MTDRAKRAAQVLESYGWQLDDTYIQKTCATCGHYENEPGNYCRQCGHKLPVHYGGSTLDEIEAAIAAALQE